ncbi:hypothetical protein SCLCIDRAFT_1061132 [Scleroderma citrinum Foug A]|uniref:Uncharacterized protein n=1 Tax=Scleroderma citrinum Foug A TaxID=1036808 RepID=A0A0C3DR73_9AGAM|nr:hypothetical protein SCLCIDRAFT_1061132 [Scleroderma citrinum Foug A]
MGSEPGLSRVKIRRPVNLTPRCEGDKLIKASVTPQTKFLGGLAGQLYVGDILVDIISCATRSRVYLLTSWSLQNGLRRSYQ